MRCTRTGHFTSLFGVADPHLTRQGATAHRNGNGNVGEVGHHVQQYCRRAARIPSLQRHRHVHRTFSIGIRIRAAKVAICNVSYEKVRVDP